MDTASRLKQRLENREAKICIVGMGYVGIPLMLRFIEVGFQVLGLDVDADRVQKLNSGKSYILHFPDALIAGARAKGFEATADFARAQECDALIICVPTPLNRFREPDLSYVVDSMEALKPHLRAGQIVSLESTTYPGTTEEELLPRITERGLKVGQDVFLVYSPEREDPGNAKFSTRTIPKVCGGHTPACLDAGLALYGPVIDKVVPVSSTKAAEMTKLLENIHRSVNIGLVNEMKIVADKMGIDIFEVIRAAATKPFGFTAYYPGPGLGGHCIPIDPFYLTWKAREYGVHTKFIELSGEINSSMPRYVTEKIFHGLNLQGRAVRGSKILLLGLAYKKNVDDVRESPAFEILKLLRELGADASYSDPHVPVYAGGHDSPVAMKSVPATLENLRQAHAVVIVTDHDAFDWKLVREAAPLIIDCRGVYKDRDPKIVKA